jgi:microcin C transport system substrate-binding protein
VLVFPNRKTDIIACTCSRFPFHREDNALSISRRKLLQGSAALASVPFTGFAGVAFAQSENGATWRHALSLFGDIKYPAGFKHFEYVNPAAPKGGVIRLTAIGTFDNFNYVASAVKGNIASGVGLIQDQLMARAQDEISTEYGQLAESVSHADDFSSVTYRLRANARWHDGKPVTAEDVIFSMEALKKHHPFYGGYYRNVTKVEKTAERDITFTFDVAGNRELPMIIGELSVLPKHWWEGKDKDGKQRDISATTLEPPLGCGAYKVKSFEPGRTIVYERVADYWGKDLNTSIGQNNFDEIRYEYYRDTTVALEAFKGDQLDWRDENSAKNWATAYDFPALRDKRVVREEFPVIDRGVMQAFIFNTRRDKFKDPRVRLAFNFAFDFEEMNKLIFFGQYTRVASYFEGTELASRDLPRGLELEILETVRDKVPAEVFKQPYTNPTGGNPAATRANILKGTKLLSEAGWEIRDRKLVNVTTGEPMTVEFLLYTTDSARYVEPYKPNLEKMGITVSSRVVDAPQYQTRVRARDFDIIGGAWGQTLSPGNEQRSSWGAEAADQPGSRNYAGIKNPAIDTLIERVIFAKSREELVAATRAMDRVLLWNHYVVPQWTYPKDRSARWDRFGRPQLLPKYGRSGFPSVWWWDAEKAAKTGGRT